MDPRDRHEIEQHRGGFDDSGGPSDLFYRVASLLVMTFSLVLAGAMFMIDFDTTALFALMFAPFWGLGVVFPGVARGLLRLGFGFSR